MNLTTTDSSISRQQRTRYEHNLIALDARQPDVADVIRSTTIPETVTSAIGRDGSTTFQLRRDDGRRSWFGQSSMPSISAPELFANAGFHGGNAALPGILTGYEPLVLLERRPAFAALFVLEEDPLNLALAFHLYDYGQAIAAGRLVFLLTGDFAANFTRFIRRYPGYEMPSHLVHVPQRSTAELLDLQRRLEEAGRSAVDVQNRQIADSLRAINSRPRACPSESPRVALVSADPRAITLDQVARLERALHALGWTHEVCAPFTPEQRHAVARLRAIERSRADVVVFVNRGAEALRGALPAQLPLITWWMGQEGEKVPENLPLGPLEVVAWTGPAEASIPAAGPAVADRLIRIEPAADDRTVRSGSATHEQRPALDLDVVIPSDLPEDSAEACGIALASHVTLWNAVRRIVHERIDRPEPPEAGLIVTDAARAADMTLEVDGVRARFEELIRHRALPAAAGRSLALACLKNGLSVGVLGQHWSEVESPGIRLLGALPGPSEVRSAFDGACVMALPSCSTIHVQTALDALYAGAAVCLRTSEDVFRERYPGLSDLADLIGFAPTSRRLAAQARKLVLDRQRAADSPDSFPSSERAERLARHTVSSRLRLIIDQVRARFG